MTDLVRKSLNLAFVALLTVWTLVAGFFIFRVYLTGQTPLNPATGFHSDYVRVFVLGKMMNQYGEKAVYDKVIHDRTMDEVVYPVKRTGCSYITYPPNVVFLFSFISRIPLALGQVLWISFGIALSTLSLLLLRRTVSSSASWASDLFVVLSSFGSYSFFDMCRLGQTTPYILSGTALCYYFARRGRPILAGLVTVLAAVKPQYCILWLIPLLAMRNWKALSTACAVHLLLLLATGFYCGFAIYSDYLKYAAGSNHSDLDNLRNIMITLGGLFTVFGNPTLTNALSFLIFALGNLALYLLFTRCRRSSPEALVLCLSLSVLSGVLTNLYALWYDASLVTIVSALLISSPRIFGVSGSWLERAVNLMLLCFPIFSWLPLAVLVSLVKSPALTPTMILSVSGKSICLYLAVLAVLCLLRTKAVGRFSQSAAASSSLGS